MEERLLIAGMGGVIGRQLALEGLKQGFKVFGTVRGPIPSELDFLRREEKIYCFNVDLRQKKQVQKVVSEVKPDVIVNLAGHSENKPSLGSLILDENMAILENLLNSILHSGRGRERIGRETIFVQAGTIWEYGQNLGETPIVEIPCNRLPSLQGSNFYAQSKIEAENLLLEYYRMQSGVNPILLRLAHHTGEGKHSGFTAVGADAVLNVKKEKEDTILIRNKLGKIDLSYARDGARAISFLIINGTAGEAYNIARGSENNIEEILMIMANKLNLSPSVRVVSTGEEHETHARFNIQRLLSLGYQPLFSLTETVNRFMDWYCRQDSDTSFDYSQIPVFPSPGNSDYITGAAAFA